MFWLKNYFYWSWFFFAEIYLSNLNASCIRCLCESLTNCDVTRGCQNQYCGPFSISRIYWADAGKVTFPDDNENRENAFSDCARDYNCASKIITNYMIKYAKDCNNDGVVDCLDYSLIHVNGYPSCHLNLSSAAHGKEFFNRYQRCKLY